MMPATFFALMGAIFGTLIIADRPWLAYALFKATSRA